MGHSHSSRTTLSCCGWGRNGGWEGDGIGTQAGDGEGGVGTGLGWCLGDGDEDGGVDGKDRRGACLRYGFPIALAFSAARSVREAPEICLSSCLEREFRAYGALRFTSLRDTSQQSDVFNQGHIV